MKDSSAIENEDYRKRTGDTTGQFASKDDSRRCANGGTGGGKRPADFGRNSLVGKENRNEKRNVKSR